MDRKAIASALSGGTSAPAGDFFTSFRPYERSDYDGGTRYGFQQSELDRIKADNYTAPSLMMPAGYGGDNDPVGNENYGSAPAAHMYSTAAFVRDNYGKTVGADSFMTIKDFAPGRENTKNGYYYGVLPDGKEGAGYSAVKLQKSGDGYKVVGADAWDELQESDSGQFFGLIASIALMAFGFPGALAAGMGGGTAGAIGAGAIMGATSSALTGGDPLKGAVLGGVGGGIGSYMDANPVFDGGSKALANQVTKGAVTGLAKSALTKGDIANGILSGAAGGAINTYVPTGKDASFTDVAANILGKQAVGGLLNQSKEVKATDLVTPQTNTGTTNTSWSWPTNHRQAIATALRG